MSVGFLDSNVLVYAFSDDPRSARAREFLEAGATIGVQSLNEFANVARKKLRMDWREIEAALDEIGMLCTVVAPITRELHRRGLELAERYRLAIYDGLIVAAALGARTDVLWSEDMHNGLIVEGRLEIVNPFAGVVF